MAQTNTNLDQNKFAAAEELPKAQSKVKEFTKKFMKRKTAVVSLVFILFIVLMAIIAPFVVPYAPDQPDYTALLQGPSSAHIWGVWPGCIQPSDGRFQTVPFLRSDRYSYRNSRRRYSGTDRWFLRRFC